MQQVMSVVMEQSRRRCARDRCSSSMNGSDEDDVCDIPALVPDEFSPVIGDLRGDVLDVADALRAQQTHQVSQTIREVFLVLLVLTRVAGPGAHLYQDRIICERSCQSCSDGPER